MQNIDCQLSSASNLNINQAKWAEGKIFDKINILGKKENLVHIPFALNFLQIGTSLYQEISSGGNLNYKLNGNAKLSSSLDILGEFNLPFNLSGNVNLTK